MRRSSASLPFLWGMLLLSCVGKNLIRSGLKFNHWLKELILGAIGGWCPLHLIVPRLFLATFSWFRNTILFLSFFIPHFFTSLTLFLFDPAQFFQLRSSRSSSNLLCIDINPRYLINRSSVWHFKNSFCCPAFVTILTFFSTYCLFLTF